MFRSLINSAWRVSAGATNICWQPPQQLSFSTLLNRNLGFQRNILCPVINKHLLAPATAENTPERTLTKFSLVKGKRKAVKAVIRRFKRLDWGCWIRTHCGRHKKMFKKSPALKRRLRQHIFVNATQSWLLDKMVTNFWRKPKYYIDDPYEPYHKREEYWSTRKKPVDYIKRTPS